MTTILVQYHKRSGSKISAQFGWQFTNSDGSSYLSGDTGAVFSQSADTWKHQRFYYSGIARPSGYPCVRGVLYSGGHTFVTKVLC